VFIGAIIYLTYFFTLSFSTHPPAPAPVPESVRAAAKKSEELRAEERKLQSTYGPVDPATKAVRLPIDRAMELLVKEGSQPAPAQVALPTSAPTPSNTTGGPALKAPQTETVATTAKAGAAAAPTVSTAPPPPPARAGMAPDQLYRAICIACHDADGKGNIVRKAMPTIPDLTDAKWQASRTDAELAHSIVEGKGQFMLPMKDKFALAHTEVKEMIAFMRSFQSGKQVVAAGPPAQSPFPVAAPTAAALSPTAPVTPSSPVVTALPSPFATAAVSPTTAAPGAVSLAPALANPAQASQSAASAIMALAPTPSVSSAPAREPSPAQTAQLQAAAEFYRVNCLACHGPDGRGSAVRIAMPLIPDFTTREWQTSRDNPQLAASILDGKGLFMPPWRGKIAPELAQNLAAFVRSFGPAGLLASTNTTSEFGTHFMQLRKQWEDINLEIKALSGP
jgi:mono/diheme cytochrome c family protein